MSNLRNQTKPHNKPQPVFFFFLIIVDIITFNQWYPFTEAVQTHREAHTNRWISIFPDPCLCCEGFKKMGWIKRRNYSKTKHFFVRHGGCFSTHQQIHDNLSAHINWKSLRNVKVISKGFIKYLFAIITLTINACSHRQMPGGIFFKSWEKTD